jgi:predicted RNA binding protein YcfA (HicA-like mRNA interferase family)
MSPLPVCSGADAVRAFRKIGYEVDHQTGSHMILRHPSGRRLTVALCLKMLFSCVHLSKRHWLTVSSNLLVFEPTTDDTDNTEGEDPFGYVRSIGLIRVISVICGSKTLWIDSVAAAPR